jgi:hypothetical protein
MRKSIITAAATGALLLLTACGPATALDCPSEDYSGPTACHWDASKQGNGQGQSFMWTGSKVIYSSK